MAVRNVACAQHAKKTDKFGRAREHEFGEWVLSHTGLQLIVGWDVLLHHHVSAPGGLMTC